MPTSSSSASTRANRRVRTSTTAEPEHPGHLGVLVRDDVGAVAGRRHELARDRGVVAQHVREEERVGAPVRDAEARADRVGERVVDADERVGERQPGDRRGVGHLACARRGRRRRAKARGSASRIRWTACRQKRVGVRRGEDRHVGLERVRQRVDAGVGGQRRRHRERQPRLDDRHVGDQRVVDERELARRRRSARRPARPRSRCRRSSARRPGGRGAGSCGKRATRLRASRNGSVSSAQRQLGMLVRAGASPWRRRSPSRRRRPR